MLLDCICAHVEFNSWTLGVFSSKMVVLKSATSNIFSQFENLFLCELKIQMSKIRIEFEIFILLNFMQSQYFAKVSNDL